MQLFDLISFENFAAVRYDFNQSSFFPTLDKIIPKICIISNLGHKECEHHKEPLAR